MTTGVDKAIEAAGGKRQLAALFNVTEQAINNFKRKGWFPVDRARVVADAYGIPLADLVRADFRQALLNS
jgi:hypothetical protein